MPHVENGTNVAMENQLVYKIAALEATITNSLRRIDEKIDRMQVELHDRHIEHAAEMSRLASSVENRFTLKRARIDALEEKVQRVKDASIKDCEDVENKLCERVDKIEKWQSQVITRASTIGAGVVVMWGMFGQYVQDFFGRMFNGG